MFRYLPVETGTAGADPLRCFGLRILRSEAEEERELMVLPHVSTDFGFTLRLASLLTRKQTDPLRLLEILEGFL